MAILIAAITLILVYGLFLLRRKIQRDRIISNLGCQPPPSLRQTDPILGLDIAHQLLKSIKENRRSLSMTEQFKTYGNTFQSRPYGQTKIFTIEPQNLQSVFTTNFQSWGVEDLRLFAFAPFVGKGIMCTDGPSWQQSRAVIKPIFARPQMKSIHLSMFATHVDRLVTLLPQGESMVDLQPLFARLALDSSTEFLFGKSVGSLDPGKVSTGARDFLDAYNYGQAGVGKRLQLPKWNFLTRDSKFTASCKTAHDFVDHLVNRAKAEGDSKRTKFFLAQQLIDVTDDQEFIRDQLLNIFMPAHEATGVALTNIFFNLARNPSVYEKLHQEVTAQREDKEWTFERLKGFRYLQYVIKESLRLNPPIGTTARMALNDTTLPIGGGPTGTSPIFVRKGDVVTFGFYALHRRCDIFGEDADLFRPERWESEDFRPFWGYLPFGGGPRVCPGQQMALMEASYVIVRFVEVFKRIVNRDDVLEFVEDYKVTTTSKNGAKASLIRA